MASNAVRRKRNAKRFIKSRNLLSLPLVSSRLLIDHNIWPCTFWVKDYNTDSYITFSKIVNLNDWGNA